MTDLEGLVNKTVEFAYRGARLRLDLSHALFSSFDIDSGTRLLLKEIAHDDVFAGAKRLLDSGCGTGVIGIAMAASCPAMDVTLRDRDLLACAFTERNCWRNAIPATRFGIGGQPASGIEKRRPKHFNNQARTGQVAIRPALLGEDDPGGEFGAVLSNLPAKAGVSVLSRFVMKDAPRLLEAGGRLAFVIVNTLAEEASRWCAQSPLALLRTVTGKGHSVFILEKPAESATTASQAMSSESWDVAYLRTDASRNLGRYAIRARGWWGLPEFDTESHATTLAIEALEKACAGSLVRDFLVAEPGIGLAALWTMRAFGPSRIRLMSRDILALRASELNLRAAAAKGQESILVSSLDADDADCGIADASCDAVLWNPDEIPGFDTISPAWKLLERITKKGGAVVIVSTPTIVSRFDKIKPSGFSRLGERKWKGFASGSFRRV